MNYNSKLLLAVAVALTFVVAPVVSAQEDGGYGSKVVQGDSDFLEQFVAADTADDANAGDLLVQCDPDTDVDGDELYYLRIAEDASGDDEIQELDLDLQSGELVADGDDAMDCSESDVDEGFSTTFDVIAFDNDDENFWYVDLDGDGDLDRFDLRLTEVEVDGETYEVGSQVGLGDNDFELFDAAGTSEDADLTLADISWFDSDDNEEFSDGDSLLIASVNGDDGDVGDPETFAALDDVRLTPDFGTVVGQGSDDDLERFVAAATADDTNAGDLVIQCDPDTDVDGDELYYLRLNEDQTGTDEAIQEMDIDLQSGEYLADGDDALDCAEADTDESYSATFDIVILVEDDENLWYFDADSSGDLTRFDLRMSEVTIDGETYDVGSQVALGDNDLELNDGDVDTFNDYTLGEISWYDADDNEEVSEEDSLLLTPSETVDDFAALDDLRLQSDFGTIVDQTGGDFRAQYEAADGADNFDGVDDGVLECDPDTDVEGDELYYLRIAESESDDDSVQALDLDLQTGELLAEGDDALDCSESDIDLDFFGDGTMHLIAFNNDDEDYWYLDLDDDDEVSRFDLRITDIEVDGEEYEAGSMVSLGSNDFDLFGGIVADNDGTDEDCFGAEADEDDGDLNQGLDTDAGATPSIADGDCEIDVGAADISWYDADNDEEVSAGDAMLLNLRRDVGTDAVGEFAVLGDIRLFGEADPTTDDDPTDEPTTDDTTTDDTTTDDTTTDDTTTDDTTTDDGTTDDTTTDDDNTDEPSEDEPKTPGFEVVALVAALGAALVLVRRKL